MSTDPSISFQSDTRAIPRAELRGSATKTVLSATAGLWWVVTVIGQWAFLYYVAGFYVRAIAAGHIEDWNRNHTIFQGYVAGDTAWNSYFGAHMVVAAVIAFGGVLQLVPWIRQHAAWFHRWNGRVFASTALVGSVTGLWMSVVRGVGVSGSNSLGLIAISLDAVLIIIFAAITWWRVRARRIASHRRWALRLFLVTNGVWFLRLALYGWYLLTGGLGLTDQLDGPMNIVMDFASYLLPLGVLELYLFAKDRAGTGVQILAGVVLLASTAYMAIGIVALTIAKLPLMPGL